MSFIFNQMPEEASKECGYIVPTSPWNPLDDSFNSTLNLSGKAITKDTRVYYFYGTFGVFHAGHLSVVYRTARAHKREFHNSNYIIVIAPSHSENVVAKYGDDISDTDRVDSILEGVAHLSNIVIDMNPSLNHTCEQNFTDHLKYFVDKNCPVDYYELTHVPVLIGGKDKDYRMLNSYVNDVEYWHFVPTITMDTSKILNNI